jgi:hypothetical protein
MPEVVQLRASDGRRYVVETGVIDDRALLGFTMGQCHAMALALREKTGGPIVGLVEKASPFDHLLTRSDDGRLIDIGGARSPDLISSGGQLTEVDVDTVRALTTDHGWEVPQLDIARLFVSAVLEGVQQGRQHRQPTCFTHDFSLGDILDIHIEWSIFDTGERLTAFGRRPDDPLGTWVRCATQAIKPDALGNRIIEFTPEVFAAHAKRFEIHIRELDTAIETHFLAALNPQQPLKPPS